MKKKMPTQAEFLKTARIAMTAKTGFEKKGGQCKRLVRQICEASGLDKSLCPPPGLDANQTANWYRVNHPEMIVRNGGLPGDIYCYEVGHGTHGHMGIREYANVIIQNTEAIAPEGKEDARGILTMKRTGRETLIIRPWRN